ncbi:class I SAM-dependent methyltransferase [Leptospira gomenensis]|nr:class I SAM-dependent methyltransferase [Leptospira gomenensis]
MNRIETTVLLHRRKRLLRPLRGKILEVGSGTGINFPLYSPGADVLAIEPSRSMMQKAEERMTSLGFSRNAGSSPEIRTATLGIGDPELENLVPPNSVDAVVFTLVLCTVPDPEYAIRFAKSRLKKGGKLLLLEHVRASTSAGRILQKTLNPFWTRFAQGCNLDREPVSLVRAAGFRLLEEDRFRDTLPFYQAIYESI